MQFSSRLSARLYHLIIGLLTSHVGYDAPCPEDTNPAEHMIDVVSGSLSQGRDWNDVWLNSPEHKHTVEELERITSEAAGKPPGTTDDGHEFATTLWEQTKLVSHRMNVSLWRNTDYINNKFALHIGSALFNGFTFWMIGDSVADLQQRLFTIFNFIFVAPGVIAQLQPLFIERRDIFETREKKSKMYDWKAFTVALIVSELPYLCVCAVLYFVCWYYTVGFPTDSNKAVRPHRTLLQSFTMLILSRVLFSLSCSCTSLSTRVSDNSLLHTPLTPCLLHLSIPSLSESLFPSPVFLFHTLKSMFSGDIGSTISIPSHS